MGDDGKEKGTMHKWIANLHGHKAGLIWYQLSIFALSLYGAWSVSVAIDTFYTTGSDWDKNGLKLFAWIFFLLFGGYLVTQWASITHEMRADEEQRGANSRRFKVPSMAIAGVYFGVALMIGSEALARASVFLRLWPNVSSIEIVFAVAVTLYFCVPILLGPAMAHRARKIREDEVGEADKKAQTNIKSQLHKALASRVSEMPDEELVQKFGHLLTDGSATVDDKQSSFYRPLLTEQATQQSEKSNRNGRG
jgi:hypothetical protein